MAAEKRKRDPTAEFVYRHEAKYLIPLSMVAQIREFIQPFCDPDEHCKGFPPEYVVTTLQLDTPTLALHMAKELEALNRFKLRVRTYGEPGSAPVFAEVKRKFRGCIAKARAVIPYDLWSEDLVKNPLAPIRFSSPKQDAGFLEFRRLVKETLSEPYLLIRYTRESYAGHSDHYSRVTFDRNLLYQPTRSWTGFGRGGRWFQADSSLAQTHDLGYSAVVLELKTLPDAPHWMLDLIETFELERTGNCKYSTAVWREAVFRGEPQMHFEDALDFAH